MKTTRTDPITAPPEDLPEEGVVGPGTAQPLAVALSLAFAPLHKRAFGMAVGIAAALLVAGVTLFHVVAQPEDAGYLRLLANYFYGYTVTWRGVVVGGLWAFLTGFVAGWFIAFCRNLVIAISIFITRTRAELRETRDFLDHI